MPTAWGMSRPRTCLRYLLCWSGIPSAANVPSLDFGVVFSGLVEEKDADLFVGAFGGGGDPS